MPTLEKVSKKTRQTEEHDQVEEQEPEITCPSSPATEDPTCTTEMMIAERERRAKIVVKSIYKSPDMPESFYLNRVNVFLLGGPLTEITWQKEFANRISKIHPNITVFYPNISLTELMYVQSTEIEKHFEWEQQVMQHSEYRIFWLSHNSTFEDGLDLGQVLLDFRGEKTYIGMESSKNRQYLVSEKCKKLFYRKEFPSTLNDLYNMVAPSLLIRAQNMALRDL